MVAMAVGDHISEDTLELYSMGRLGEVEAARLEEHLLVCEACRERLELDDEFIATLRQAVEEDPSPGGAGEG